MIYDGRKLRHKDLLGITLVFQDVYNKIGIKNGGGKRGKICIRVYRLGKEIKVIA